MKITKFNELFTLFANVGVLLGIIFLAVEINQNTRTTQITAYQALTESIIDINSLILLDGDVERIRYAALTNDPNISEEDTRRYIAYLRILQRQSELAFVQFENGFIDGTLARRSMGPLLDHLGRSDLAKDFWQGVESAWPEFGQFVDELRREPQNLGEY